MRVAIVALAASTASGFGVPAAEKVVVKTLPARFSMCSTSPSLVARNSGRPPALMSSAR